MNYNPPLGVFLIVASNAVLFAASAELAIEDRGDHPLRTWTVKFVDEKTKAPLPGTLATVQQTISSNQQKQDSLLKSDASGEIKISLRKGDCTSLRAEGPGWCLAAGIPIVGDLPAHLNSDRSPPGDPSQPRKIELFRGTELRGRLLLPDGNPAASISLIAGVHCNQPPWISEGYQRYRMTVSFSDSDWPNWSVSTKTAGDGSFSITVPPCGVRGWIRIGTIRGDFSSIDTSRVEKLNPGHALVRFAPFELEINGDNDSRQVDETTGILELGDLQLSRGIVLRGRVVDADGGPMSGVHLLTSSKHGPYAGRATVSRPDGSFEFMPMNAGTITLKPDAHRRNDNGEKTSRDEMAVFISQPITLHEDVNPHELVVHALPHVELVFDWVDRRAEKGPVSYYGTFTLMGTVVRPDGSKVSWRGETERATRENKEVLVVKVPASATQVSISLHPDSRVLPSYSDSLRENQSGQVDLGDISRRMRRTIYGDEPHVRD